MGQSMGLWVGSVGRVLILSRKNKGPVRHRDALAGSLQQKTPFRLFDLSRDVDRVGPCQAIVLAFDDYPLASLFRFQSGATATPRPVAMRPRRGNEDGSRYLIEQNG